MTKTPEALAIIIATKDHPEELRRLLASVQAQSALPCQVILVDGGAHSVDGIGAEFPRLPITHRRVVPPGLAKQHNAGVACVAPAATLVGFLDDDIVLEPGALEAMLAFWDAAPPDVGGASFNLLSNTEPARAVRLKALFGLDDARPGLVLRSGYQTRIGAVSETRQVAWLNSGTTVWRKRLLEERRFDEWFHGPGHLYDVDFSFDMGRRYRLMVVAGAGVREIPSPARRWNDYAFGQWQVVNRLYFVGKYRELSLLRCCWALVGHTLVNLTRGVLERDAQFLRRAGGNLVGWGRAARFLFRGLPHRRRTRAASEAPVTARTAKAFGYLWQRSAGRPDPPAYHVDRMQDALALPAPQGLMLDAGCGEGIDLANQARRPGVEIVGVELSAEGCRVSQARCRALPRAFIVQGDLARLPFADGTFDLVYSYGVLHHLASPLRGLQELVRVLKPGAPIAVYLYEDFRARPIVWRALLATTNACRKMTTRLPPAVLYRLCHIGSPIVFALLTVPHRILRRLPGAEALAATIPFRHGTGPFSLAGDLYDRFSAPIERRYSREDTLALLRQAGLEELLIANDRGWMAAGRKPRALAAVAAGALERNGHGA